MAIDPKKLKEWRERFKFHVGRCAYAAEQGVGLMARNAVADMAELAAEALPVLLAAAEPKPLRGSIHVATLPSHLSVTFGQVDMYGQDVPAVTLRCSKCDDLHDLVIDKEMDFAACLPRFLAEKVPLHEHP